MVTIGNDTLPGPITTLESADSVGANIGAPGTPVFCGQAYLSNGNASADTAKKITRPKKAAAEFGDPSNSLLTQVIQDALAEGAYPVYAIAPPETDVTGEDLSNNNSKTGTLANAPVIEVASDITFTINSTTKTTVLYYDGDPANASPGTDEVYLNPQTGKFKIDEQAGNAGDDVDYSYVDYSNTFDEITNATINDTNVREVVDFVVPVDEKDSVATSAETKVNNMESNGWLSVSVVGAGDPYIADTSNYSDSFDNSRVQLVYPSRKDDPSESFLGAYIGRRSALGIDATPIFKRVSSVSALQFNLSRTQREDLVNSNVIPIEERQSAVRIVEDLTTVEDANSTEAAWDRGFARLVTDHVAERVEAISQAYIGDFNNPETRNSLATDVSEVLDALLESQSIEAYSLVVEEIDSVTAAVDIGINTADPLRNIELNVAAGKVRNGTQAGA